MWWSAIQTRWGTVSALNSLVPSARLILGPPIAGWPIPVVALTSYQQSKRQAASTQHMHMLLLQMHIEASTGSTVEQIAQAILDHLLPVTHGAQRLVSWDTYSLDFQRDATSEHLSGLMTLTCHMWSTS